MNEEYSDRMLKELFGKDYVEISEGLIRTISPEKVEQLLDFNRVNVKGTPFVYENNMIGVRFLDLINKHITKLDKSDYDKLAQVMNNLGYFPALYRTNEKGLKLKKFDIETILHNISKQTLVEIVFAAKFSVPISHTNVPKILYHVCDGSVIEKIKKIGLSPRTKNKIEQHPDRVYLCKTAECVRALLNHQSFIQKTTSDKIYILRICTSKLGDGIDFYVDPSHDDAIYTTENISPGAIEIASEITKKK